MHRASLGMVSVAAVMALVGCGPAVDDGTDEVGQITDMAKSATPTGKNLRTILTAGNHSKSKVAFHPGPVLTGTQDVYLIWYGNWSNNASAQFILADFVSNLGSSPYFQINSRYPNSSGQAPSGALIFGGSAVDAYSHGPSLSDADLASVVSDQISTGGLPLDPSGIYVILASADVTATSGFCTAYCGSHNSGTVLGSQFRYIFVGNADRCPSACSPQAVSPNGNAGADAMVNALANELSSTVTDPTLGTWYDRDGFENADKCAWTYGTTFTTANGAQANIHLGARDYLLQQNFWPTSRGGVCVMSPSQAAAAIAAGEDILAN
jgi:hypothetical protein